ncbi:MAG: hypothetical protein ACYDBQ_05400 [Thermoplasmatota archaeon]
MMVWNLPRSLPGVVLFTAWGAAATLAALGVWGGIEAVVRGEPGKAGMIALAINGFVLAAWLVVGAITMWLALSGPIGLFPQG